MDEVIIGVDLGGTKVQAGRVEKGRLSIRAYREISSRASQEVIIDEIVDTIKKVFSPEVTSIGVGVPSIVDLEQGIVYDVENIPSWKEVPLKSILEDRFSLPVCINNDANCFALGEYRFGKGRGFKNLVGITIGTGIGAGIIINGNLYSGTNCGAGEIGAFPYKDRWIEYYASGQFFQNEYGIDGRQVFERARKGDRWALEVMNEFGHHVGEAIKAVLHAYDPEIVILGGSIVKSFQFFKNSMFQSINEFNFKRVIERLKIEVSEDPSIPILGAAALCIEKHQ